MNDVNQGSINAASTRPGDSFSGQAVVGPAAPLRDLPQIDSSTQGQPAANPLSSDRVHPIRFAPLHKTAPPPALRILGETALILLVLVLTGAVSSLTPVGAIFLAFGASILLEVAGAGGPKKFWERFIFDISTIKWQNVSDDRLYSEIRVPKPHAEERGVRVLGAMPCKEDGRFEKMFSEKNIGLIVTVQSRWEQEPTWLRTPYTTQDYEDRGIEHLVLYVDDHHYPPGDQLIPAAKKIQDTLKKTAGKNGVYVHCKAGQGRSAMVYAAELIQNYGMSAERARDTIFQSRPTSTIAKKLEDTQAEIGLKQFAATADDAENGYDQRGRVRENDLLHYMVEKSLEFIKLGGLNQWEVSGDHSLDQFHKKYHVNPIAARKHPVECAAHLVILRKNFSIEDLEVLLSKNAKKALKRDNSALEFLIELNKKEFNRVKESFFSCAKEDLIRQAIARTWGSREFMYGGRVLPLADSRIDCPGRLPPDCPGLLLATMDPQ